jgi:type II secretory pathway component PulK
MAVIMDRLSVTSVPALPGLINVNTAPLEVLKSIPGISPEQAEAIFSRRSQIPGPEKATPAWLVANGVLDPVTFALISNQVTARSIQFTVDSIGFADHVGVFKRIQAMVEMRGQLAQIKYYRDISSLGLGFPIRDDQRSEGFAFSDK